MDIAANNAKLIQNQNKICGKKKENWMKSIWCFEKWK